MGRQKTEKYVELKPKNEKAKQQLAYHGERWIFREERLTLKFVRDPGPWLVCFSRDGTACIHVKKTDDPNFNVRCLF